MSFDQIIGQEEAIGSLRQAIRLRRIPSALLFLGPHHVGKRSTALALAKALNCERDALEDSGGCGQCPSCRKIDERVHPDVEVVEPDGQFIKIDQVREIGDKLALIAWQARRRVVILSKAECMNHQAANAFLKTLEEPPPDTLVVLCAEHAAQLPETIVSRCVPVRFRPLSETQAGSLLRQVQDVQDDVLDFSVRFAQGCLRPELPERAGHWMQIRDALIKGLEGLHRPVFHQVSQEMARWGGNEDWRFVLEWLESWFRDLALFGAGIGPENLINRDRMGEMETCARWFDPPRALECFRKVLDTRDSILINANKTLALEDLWLGFKL